MLKNIDKKNHTQGGLSLIEVLVTTALIGLLGAGLLTLQFILGQNQQSVINNYLSIDEANTQISKMVRELRGARTGDNGAYVLETANDQEISFYSDIDFDDTTERVRYFLNGDQLSKGIIEPTTFPISYPQDEELVIVVSENVRNLTTPIFSYYNSDWPQDTINNPLAAPDRLSDTRSIHIYLRLNTRDDEPESDFILESDVHIRSLKDNL